MSCHAVDRSPTAPLEVVGFRSFRWPPRATREGLRKHSAFESGVGLLETTGAPGGSAGGWVPHVTDVPEADVVD